MRSLSRIPQALAAASAREPARVVAYVALYLALAWVSYIHPMRGLNITPWNPHSALAVALLLWRPRSWWLVWLAALPGEALVPVEPMGWGPLLLSSGMLTAGYAVTAAALRRWSPPRPALPSRRELVLFLLITAAGALLGAALKVAALVASGGIGADRVLAAIHRGTIGDCAGLFVTLPLLLLLASRERRSGLRAMFRNPEWWAVVAVAALATVLVFARPAQEQFKMFYVLFLPVVWGAARFGVAGAVWSSAVVQVSVMVAVQSAPYQPLTVFELQLLVAVLAATGLLLGTTVDEREEAGRALRASLRLAAAGDMAAALAHELNQPLTAMSTYAHASQVLAERLAKDAGAPAAPLVDVTGRLAEEAGRAAEVVKRLRNFFRDQATQLQPIALGALLREAVEAQVARALAWKVRLTWSCDPDDAVVWLDPVQIGVVLRNVLANGLEAASQAAAQGGGPGWVALEARREGDDIVVAVTDSAPGLRGDETATVFERRRSDKPGGMGIGLAISRSIVEAHGGRLWAEPGPGGRFLFTLPLASHPAHE